MNKYLSFLLVLSCCFLSAKAQEDHVFNFKHLSIKDGLAQNSVLGITKDTTGFMWFATFSGLNKYDGNGFTNYVFDPQDSLSISNSNIYALYTDENNNIWIGTGGGGINKFDQQSETFTRFTSRGKNAIAGDHILAIHGDKNYIWAGTGSGLSRIDKKTHEVKNYLNDADSSVTNYEYVINCIFENDPNYLWLGTHFAGLIRFNKQSGKIQLFNMDKADPKTINTNTIFAIETYNTDTLLIGTNKGYSLFVVKSNRFFNKLIDPKFEDNSVQTMAKDSAGNFWMGTNNGLYQLNGRLSILNKFTNNIHNPNSIGDNDIFKIYIDNKNVLWFGLSRSGLSYLMPKKKAFHNIEYNPKTNFLPNPEIFGLFEKNNTLWIASLNGVTKWDLLSDEKKHYTHVEGQKNGLAHKFVWQVFQDSKNRVWIGTENGVNVLDPDSEMFTHISAKKDSIINTDYVYSFTEDHEGNIWIGTYWGLSKYNPETNKSTIYKSSAKNNSGLIDSKIWVLYTDHRGVVWTGTQKGIYSYQKDQDRFSMLMKNPSDSSSAINYEVLFINESDDSTLIVGTNFGFFEYNLYDSTFKHYNKTNGLDVSTVYNVQKHKNDYWLSSNSGIYRFNPKTKSLRNYSANEGVKSIEFNPSGIKLSDGRIMFGGVKGITWFYPDSIGADVRNQKVVFTKAIIDLETLKAKKTINNYIPLKESISTASEIKIKHNAKLLRLEFTTLDYLNSLRIEYAYKFEKDEQWINLRNESSISIINFPTGEHTLMVRASNADGNWSENITRLKLIVIPPWWKNKFFIVPASLLLLFLLYFFIKRREFKHIREKQKLEFQVQKRTEEIQSQNEHIQLQRDQILIQKRELEEHKYALEEKIKKRTKDLEEAKKKAEESDKLKSSFLSNMSHEIRTPLNAMIGFSQLLKNSGEEEKEAHLEHILQNGKELLTLINDLIDISKLESGQLKPELLPVCVHKTVHSIYKELLAKNHNKDIFINFTHQGDENIIVQSDNEKLRQILQNLTSNALKFTKKGHVEIGYSIESNHIMFFVKDTGIGISKEYFDRIFNRFYKIENPDDYLFKGTGIGLSICKGLVEVLGGNIWLESELNKGSAFYFTLPLIEK